MKKTIYFLLLCFTAFLFSCKEDEGILTPDSHDHVKFKRSMVSFAEMKAKLSSHPGKALSILGNKVNKGGEEYIQEIDTTHIIQFSNDTLTTYTMRVSTLDDENYIFSNLLIKEYNSVVEEAIIHYSPTENWLTAYQNGEHLEYDGVLIVTDIFGQTFEDTENQGKVAQNCEYSIVPIIENTCGCHNGDEIVGYTLVINCGPGGGFGPPNYTGGGPTDPIPGGGFGDPDNPGGGGGGPYSDFDYFFLSGLTQQEKDWLNSQSNILGQIYNYLENNHYSDDAVDFALWAVDYLMDNPTTTFNELLRTRTSYNSQTGDVNSNSVGGYDNTLYPILAFPQVLQNWPSIPNVIPANEFVGWDFRNHPNWDCMDYAKEQIRIKGYQISNYGDSGQTFQIYKEQTGVNLDALSKGLSYLKYALSNGIPVIVGIDNRQGSPNPQTDNTTDHFIVIVGTGIENGEIFFRFYDNASGYPHQGTHLENKLYLDNFLNMLIGTTHAEGYRESYTDYDYIVTQIRKSKPL